MNDNRFKIMFDGELLLSVEVTASKLNLAGLFQKEVGVIKKLFTGGQVAVKRDLTFARRGRNTPISVEKSQYR